MNVLFVVNDAPYGSEKVYNTLRIAQTLLREQPAVSVRIFLLADAVTSALAGQSTPPGYYNVEHMLQSVIRKGAQVSACGFCSEARGLKEVPLAPGVEAGTMSQLAQWVVDADKVLTF
jgi:uncharacterized protein involved in oxidation of intracellular sulfur